jgi:hypothetical protein
LGGWL